MSIIAQAAALTNPKLPFLPQELWDNIAKELWKTGVLSELLAQWEWGEKTPVEAAKGRTAYNQMRRGGRGVNSETLARWPSDAWTTLRFVRHRTEAVPAEERAVLMKFGYHIPNRIPDNIFELPPLIWPVVHTHNSHRAFALYIARRDGVHRRFLGNHYKQCIIDLLEKAGIPYKKSWTKPRLMKQFYAFPDNK